MINTKDKLKTTKEMAKVIIFGQMETFTKENGKKTKQMGKVK